MLMSQIYSIISMLQKILMRNDSSMKQEVVVCVILIDILFFLEHNVVKRDLVKTGKGDISGSYKNT